MISDTQTMFSGSIAADGTRSAQAITATANSTNVLDLRNAATPSTVDEGLIEEGWLVVQVSQAFNTLTSLTIALVSSAATGLSSPTTHFSLTIALAALTAGATVVRVPVPGGDFLRYCGLIYTVNGSNPTQGSLFAYLTTAPQRNTSYATAVQFDA